MTDATKPQNIDTPQGLGFALGAYLIWGFLPLYLKMVSHIDPAEIVAHRVIWSIPIAGAVLMLLGRTDDVKAALRNPKTLAMGVVTAALITVNWGIYVWAIANDRAVDGALGYYINPLFSILLGSILLGEKMVGTQKIAVGLATLAVVILTVFAGSLPWPAIGLTVSWGLYALAKKQLPIGPNQGFLLEVLILSPFAMMYIAYVTATATGHFQTDMWLLLGCGVVTAVPLMLYANGAKLLRLSTIGIMQYIAPSMILLIAVFVFGEELDTGRLIAFPLIWAALVIYSIPMIKALRKGS